MKETVLKEDERLDFLIDHRIKIIQNRKGFCFSMDAVLLANFATVRSRDQVCDLGTGTGVIPLILADRTFAKAIYGLEIQEDMADMAQRSVAVNGMNSRIKIKQGDIKNAHQLYGSSRFDVVITNPPYLNQLDGLHSHVSQVAVARHEILCTLDDVLLAASRIVKSRGRVAMVYRPQRLTDIISSMRSVNLEPKKIRFVHPRKKAPANMVLIEAVKDGGMELKVMDPLFVYDDKEYTEEIRGIYFGYGGDIDGKG